MPQNPEGGCEDDEYERTDSQSASPLPEMRYSCGRNKDMATHGFSIGVKLNVCGDMNRIRSERIKNDKLGTFPFGHMVMAEVGLLIVNVRNKRTTN